ncbi:MAG: hypothetical protein LBU62_08030, partial [Bacteroidales bacterium]|nr:hypothetical protein [Bacteroidales bacterium]
QGISARKKALEKLRAKLSTPNPKPKKRKKPPVQIDGAFRAGECLAFLYDNGLYGGVMITECKCYRNKGYHKLIYTDIEQEKMPVLTDFLNAHILSFKWSGNLTNQQGWKYATINGCAGELSSENISYSSKENKDRLFDFLRRFFAPIGIVPAYTQVFYSTTEVHGIEKIMEYEVFAKELRRQLTYWKDYLRKSDKVSKETIGELNGLLHSL